MTATGALEPGRRRPELDAGHWRSRLATLATRHAVPGATLGILRLATSATTEVERPSSEQIVIAHHGLLSTRTGVEVTDDSLFQIGSVTKVWTATMAMQLVDEGVLDLDASITQVLPELRLRDADAAKTLTMRHLLSHTSGIDGDVFADTGRGDDCVERYVAALEQTRLNTPVGELFSYCNTAFVIAGRVVEKLTGMSWDQALRERLVEPLGLGHTVTLPEEVILHRAAVGHLPARALGGLPPSANPSFVPTPVWMLPRCLGPAGLISTTAADLLAFARMHLQDGVTDRGARVLSSSAVSQMAACEVELPNRSGLEDSWGLGWARMGWGGHRLIGHDGDTIGQQAFLILLPSQGLAACLLTNGGHSQDLHQDLFAEILASLANVEMPPPLTPLAGAPQTDYAPLLGRYERDGVHLEVAEIGGALVLRHTIVGPLAALADVTPEEFAMQPCGGSVFAVREAGAQTWTPVLFSRLSTGKQILYFRSRATPKVN